MKTALDKHIESLAKEDRFFEEVFVKKIYQPVLELGGLNTVIDLGACGGEFSFWIYDRALKIYAIEPIKKQFNKMNQILREYSLENEKICTHNLALGDFNGQGYMSETKTHGGARLMQDNQVTKNPVRVETLATFMRENNIDAVDVLKIDIEGGELGVFSASDFSQVADKIKFIIGEHGSDIQELLESHGFKYRKYNKGFIFEK